MKFKSILIIGLLSSGLQCAWANNGSFDPKACNVINQVNVLGQVQFNGEQITFTNGADEVVVSETAYVVNGYELNYTDTAEYHELINLFFKQSQAFSSNKLKKEGFDMQKMTPNDWRNLSGTEAGREFLAASTAMCETILTLDMANEEAIAQDANFIAAVELTKK